jgi:ATP-dependent helicase/nuclease subunit B
VIRTGSATRPAVYSIPLHVPFADALAEQLLRDATDNPLDLARTRILVPNRRAARALADSFLRLSSGGLLLPRLQPLGDVDALDDAGLLSADLEATVLPAVSTFERLMILTPLVEKWGAQALGRDFSAAETLRYARELARQIDQFDYAGIGYPDLEKLLPEGYSHHWQQTLKFLEIVLRQAPGFWAADGKINPAARRVQILKSLTAQWSTCPPSERIIVAGSTGSIPAVAELMSVIARLPGGTIVLPSLDTDLDDDSWDALQPNHAQYALKRLLGTMSVARQEVDIWPATPAAVPDSRTAWVNAALWPPARTPDWQNVATPADVTGAVSILEAKTDAEEARAIAVFVREQLQQPEKTIAIVTSDRGLAQRIATTLTRYDINVDDSAGQPLAQTGPAAFLRQLAHAAANDLAPVDLLAMLKHPLCCGGMTRAAWLERTRMLDKHVLRGLRPAPGLAALKLVAGDTLASDRRAAMRAPVFDLLERVEKTAGNFLAAFQMSRASALDLLHAHVSAAQELAATDLETGDARLWRGEAGQLLADTLRDIIAAVPATFQINTADYPAWLDELISGQVVRPRFGKHPRVKLLSPIEARLQRADVMVLAGLNEGSWPPAAQIDPFLADHMRGKLGLPTSEFRLGQAAHDFAQAMGAEKILLTRAEKSHGTPTLASRFWLRVQALARNAILPATEILDIARALDVRPLTPVRKPQPRPPLDARPVKISISSVSQWRKNPYAFYARKILNLSPLDPLDQDVGPLDRGNSLHKALELFFKRPHAARTLDHLMANGETAFADILSRPQVRAIWWPRFRVLAQAIMDSELIVDTDIATLTEIKGGWTIPGLKRETMIIGTADRIDCAADGTATVYDYKSGGIPTGDEVSYAYQPQMALLGLIARDGTLEKSGKLNPEKLGYIKISGRLPNPVDMRPLGPPRNKRWQTIAELMTQTAAIVQEWAGMFENDTQAYPFLQVPDRAPGHEYDYLARVAEWQGQSDS